MCGILLFSGPNAAARLAGGLDRLQHRGPDEQGSWIEGDVALGFARLAINGTGPVGHQPYHHGPLVGAINGEVYNHRELSIAHALAQSTCDTRVVLPLLERNGPRVIDDLDGFYAAVALRQGSNKALCLRDHIGKKPLFVGKSGTELFIVSELKVLDHIDWFELLPRGAAEVDLDTGEVTLLAEHRPIVPGAELRPLFEDAVAKRTPLSGQPVGVFLSGGLDSSLVAALVSRLRDDVVYFTLGDEEGPDRQAVEVVRSALGLGDVRTVSLPSPERIPDLIRSVVHATESFNPSIVSNGLATYLLAEAAHEAGIKVVLTGEGADELFGGYHSFSDQDPWREVRRRLLDDMQFTELRRLDLSCMAHSVEPRCPFLDRAVRGFSDGLAFHEMYDADQNKVALRRCFEGALPAEVLHRRKASFDVGSGLRGEVVRYLRRNGQTERDELLGVWSRLFGHDARQAHFHAYPVFDAVIDRRGATHR